VQRVDPDQVEELDVDPARREAMHRKFGFDAYGVSQDMPDPVARSIQAMLDHMHVVDERVERMCTTLRKLDADYRDGELPDLRDEDFAELLDHAEAPCQRADKPTPGKPARGDSPGRESTGNSDPQDPGEGKG
jgi:serine O-acetyltransferase